MPFIDFNTRKKIKLFDGVNASLFHSHDITFAHVTLDKGAIVPEHRHIHEQWSHFVEGEMHFNINGEEKTIKMGMTAFMPSNILHSAKAITCAG